MWISYSQISAHNKIIPIYGFSRDSIEGNPILGMAHYDDFEAVYLSTSTPNFTNLNLIVLNTGAAEGWSYAFVSRTQRPALFIYS